MSTDTPTLRQASFDLPCNYQVWVVGFVDPDWGERFGGMVVHSYRCCENIALSLLQGEFPDQAALLGLLNHLYQMHYVVLAVQQVGAEKQPPE